MPTIRVAWAIDPRGEFLFSCNQKGDSITSFRINAATGVLQFTGRFLSPWEAPRS